MCDYAATGNVDGLRGMLPIHESGMRDSIMLEASKHGHVNVLKFCISEGWECKRVLRNILKNGVQGGHVQVLEYVVRELNTKGIAFYPDQIIWNACKHGMDHVVKWCVDTLREDECNIASMHTYATLTTIWWARHDALEYIVGKGIRVEINHGIMCSDTSSEDRIVKTTVIAHENLPGACVGNGCMVCRMKNVWDTWIMENIEYKSCIQWIPQEVLVDTMNMVMAGTVKC